MIQNCMKEKLLLLVVSMITFSSYFCLLQRFDLILWFIISMVYISYATKKINIKKITITILFLVLTIYSIQLIRVSKYVVNYLFYISKMKFGVKYAFLTEPYMYIVMNLENFSNAVAEQVIIHTDILVLILSFL